MKVYLKVLIISLGICFITKTSQAQDIKPFIDFAVVDADNPLVAFDTAAIFVHVKVLSCQTHNDTGGFVGNLKYHLKSDKMGQHTPEIDPITIDNDPAVEYMPFGGKVDTLNFFVDTNFFRTAGVNPVNVIIIWPAFTSPVRPMCDSVPHILWEVPGFLSLNDEIPQTFGSTVFPNPAGPMQVVFVNSKYSKDIAQISIINAMGQVFSTKEFMPGESSLGYVLPTENLRSGIYHIHVTYQDKKNEVIKFIKN